jgi:hypothetical protein
MTRPLTELLKKGVNVATAWTQEATDAFETVKHALTTAPVLRLPDWRSDEPFEIICDASLLGVGGTLLQGNQPVAFESRKLIPAELNYAPTELEMLAVHHCCKVFRCYIEGKRVILKTDHQPNTSFATTFMPSRRQARWIDLLQGFNLEWQYIKGESNIADALSRNPVIAAVTKPSPVTPVGPRQLASKADFLTRVSAAYADDAWFTTPANVKELYSSDGLWFNQGALVIPDDAQLRNEVLLECHSAPHAGHLGRERTLKLLRRYFWWPSIASTVKRFVSSCDACQRNKSSNALPGGLLHPLSVPNNPWESVSMDFVVHLPVTPSGHTAIMVCVDRLTKMVRLAACHDSSTAEEVARLFLNKVVAAHGMPVDLVTDRDSRFTSKFWIALCDMMGMHSSMSSAFHPQSDGNTERVNRVMEDMLRSVVASDQSDWDTHLGLVEFAINNAYHESIKATPFLLNYGRHPHTPISSVIKRDAEKRVNSDKFAAKASPSACQVPGVQTLVRRMEALLATSKQALMAAQQRQKAYADTTRREAAFQVGEKVLLSTKHLSLKMRGTAKLLPKFVGPFPIVKKVNEVAFQLELPANMKAHNVFHVSLLKHYRDDPNTGPPPPPEVLGEDLEYSVERVLDHRDRRIGRRNVREYLVRWEGYGPEHNTWEPQSNMVNATPAIHDYLTLLENKKDAVSSRKRKGVSTAPTKISKRQRFVRATAS